MKDSEGDEWLSGLTLIDEGGLRPDSRRNIGLNCSDNTEE